MTRFAVKPEDAGRRLDQFLVAQLGEVSRARIQQMIEQSLVRVDGAAPKPSFRLRGTEMVEVLGEAKLAPLRAIAEDIPLDVIYEDPYIAVVNKPAGMMVHAGAGATNADRNRGTLVNALVARFQGLSSVGGDLRPGIVHRLDKATSGLIVVAKDDVTHRKLSLQFSGRKVEKTYVALVHGWPKKERDTISLSISRDLVRRTRMTTRRSGGRDAVTHYRVVEKLSSRFGQLALLDVRIETGRTHQIRVHLSAQGHPVVGDTLYGAPRQLTAQGESVSLARNFLHAARISFTHPVTGEPLRLEAPLPQELQSFLADLRR